MRLVAILAVSVPLIAANDNPVVVDNEHVRILSVVDAPHKKSKLHKHDVNRVMIYLDPGSIDLIYEDGHKDQQRWRAGQVAWSPAGAMHTSENIGGSPIRIVEIELKKPGPAAKPVRDRGMDPLVLDPKHNHLLLENAQVRVFRSWLDPGGSEKMHEHVGRGRAAVFLTDVDASMQQQTGPATKLHATRGDVVWSGPAAHAATNNGKQRMEVIVVEVN